MNFSRRRWIQASVGAIGAVALAGQTKAAFAADEPVAKNQRIKQSLVHWCYKEAWPDVDALCQTAVKLGVQSIELIDPKHWPILKKHGLKCAIASGGHGFKTGPNQQKNWDMVRSNLTERIDLASDFGCERVITFTGFSDGMSLEEGANNCVEFFKSIVGYAEKKKVMLCIEMLNTRDDTHPMKGHPGYQGDHTDYCIDIIKRVGSEHFKLLFDIYHVQIMDGDVIRRIHQHKDYLGHIHTAGNPGRGELDEDQEINYPAVMKALLDVGYDGYVGQEYIPTRDAWEGLVQAVRLCDV